MSKIYVATSLTEEEVLEISGRFPGDTFIRVDEYTQEIIDDANIIIGNPSANLVLNKESLQLMILNSAGSDSFCVPGLLHPNTKLVNASGIYGKAISEQAIGMLLSITKSLNLYEDLQRKHEWNNLKRGKEIFGSKVCIVGFGDLGYEIAKRLKGFDCHITAVKRRPFDELPDCIDAGVTIEHLDEVLAESDYCFLALPQSAETKNMFDKKRLAVMKEGSVLVNVGRGSAVVTEDLVEALESGHLFGAALDVVEPEPLPADSKLWDLPNCLITPHSSGGFAWGTVHRQYIELCIETLRRFHAGEALLNEVDFATGYRKDVRVG